MIAGGAGGVLATCAMTAVQGMLSRSVHPPTHGTPESQQDSSDDPATVKMAETIAGHELTGRSKRVGGTLVHYAIGAAAGAVYGLANEYTPRVAAGRGLAYGTAVWAIGDQVVTPAAGFSKPPQKYPLSFHVHGFLAHCAYGLALYQCNKLLAWLSATRSSPAPPA